MTKGEGGIKSLEPFQSEPRCQARARFREIEIFNRKKLKNARHRMKKQKAEEIIHPDPPAHLSERAKELWRQA